MHMDGQLRQLPIPAGAADDDPAIELLRVWAAKGKQHVTLATGLWNDPASWGIMLVDLAKHIANAYEQIADESREVALARIKAGFDAEWQKATDTPTGRVVE
jgi:uncharacterized protein DUF5076